MASEGVDPEFDAERQAILLFEELVDLPEPAREATIARHDSSAQVKARVRAMLEADRHAQSGEGRLFGTGAAGLVAMDDLAAMPERIGHYRLLAVIGRGGMGTVYRAVRDAGDFTHEVALKVIKPGLLSSELVSRFLAERQTLANLHHPHIAHIHDGGETADGDPYFVMELVEGGIAIDVWADRHQLGVAERVALVEAATSAIAYAHGRLVVHRDITPLNVLVDDNGMVKLIDFGISRPADAAAANAHDAASPTATDIAGLGRLLARLVPEPDAELQAIIATARSGGYSTADALHADLVAWRTTMPVAAMRGGDAYRIRKFFWRHRLPSVMALATLAGLVVALVAVLVANHHARAAQAQAQARFEQTRAIAKAMLFDVFDKVSRVSGATEARKSLAETALRYLDSLAEMADAPIDVVAEAGRGYVRLAEVTGGGQQASLGRYADANALLDRAAALLEPVYAAHPKDKTVAMAFAALRTEQAGVDLYNNNKPDRARLLAGEAERATAPFANSDPEAARLHASAIQAIGDSFGWNDDYAGALPHHLRADAFLESLPPAIAADREVRSARSGNLRLLAEVQHKLKMEPEARATLDRVVAINRDLLSDLPDDPQMLRKLAISLWYSAVVYRSNGQDDKATQAIDEAVGLANRMVRRDPADKSALQTLALVSEVQAQIAMDRHDRAASYAASDVAIDAHRKLVELAEGAPGALRSFTATLRTTAANHYNFGDIPEACRLWGQVLGNFATIEKQGALTALDARNALPETRAFVADICKGGKPRREWPTRL